MSYDINNPPNFKYMAVAEIADQFYYQGIDHAIAIVKTSQECFAVTDSEIALHEMMIEKLETLKK